MADQRADIFQDVEVGIRLSGLFCDFGHRRDAIY
jgi:hypothetical protein